MVKYIGGLVIALSCIVSVPVFGDDSERKDSERVDGGKRDSIESTVGSDADNEVVYKKKSLQRKYKRVLKQLKNMPPDGSDESGENDWFVVGGAYGNQINFDVFQGESDVAMRVVDFVTETKNKGEWRIFNRTPDSERAQQLLAEVKTSFQQWQKEQQAAYNRMVAEQRRRAYRRFSGFGGC